MIFNSDYDRTLWILVANNKNESDKICNLINIIPSNIYEEIQYNINTLKNNEIYKKTINNINGYDYYINVIIKNEKLYFNVRRWKEDNGNRIEEEYELILRRIIDKDLIYMDYGDKFIIGKYSHEINGIKCVGYMTNVNTSLYEKKYRITKVPLGFIISSFKNKYSNKKKYVNVFKNIPDEIVIDDFSNDDKIECLVKRRKRIKSK